MCTERKATGLFVLTSFLYATMRKWPFTDTISAFWGKFRRPLAAFDRCTLNRGAFAFKIVRGDPEVAV